MANQDNPIGDYLREIQEGHKDSTGVFTLDWTRARNRFESESLKDPSRYFHFLTQFALSMHPARIDIDYDAKFLTLRWNPGQSNDLEEMASLLRGLDSGQFGPVGYSLEYLRRALILLAGRKDMNLTYHEAGVACLELNQSGMRMAPASSDKTFLRLELVSGVRRPEKLHFWEVDLIHPIVSNHWPELKHLKQELIFYCAPVYLNGVEFTTEAGKLSYTLFRWAEPADASGPRLGMVSRIFGHIASKVVDENGRETGPGTSNRSYKTLYTMGEFVGPTKAAQATYNRQIVLIQDGMIVHQTRGPVFGLMIYHATRGLRMDADGLEAVESPERSAILQHLRQQAVRFEEQARLEVAKLPPPTFPFGNEALQKWTELRKASIDTASL